MNDTDTISTTVSNLAEIWETSERRVRQAAHEVTGAAVFGGAIEASEDDLRDVYCQLETQTA
jgi:ABC-type transporter Mla subunit MlaD